MEKPLPPPLKKLRSTAKDSPPPIGEGVVEELRRIENEDRTEQDPRDRKRTVPMEVLVLGWSRTGTQSMRAALRHLGYKGVYHMSSVVANPPDARMWAEALRWKFEGKGKPFARADWDQLLGEHQCCLDMPSCAFMPELIAAYPDAKVILVERDADAWYRSIEQTVLKVQMTIWDVPLFFLDYELFVPWKPMVRLFDAAYGGNPRDKAKTQRTYRAYHAEVRGLVPAGPRRLEYQLGDGWEPLCKFLGRKPPNGVGFPRLNDSADFLEATAYMKACGWKRVRWTLVQFVLRLAVMALIALGPLLFLPRDMFANLKRE